MRQGTVTACWKVALITVGLAAFAGSGAGFDNSGCADLAIGVPRDPVGSTANAGSAVVLYGTPQLGFGLSGEGSQIWHQDAGLLGLSENGDRFGHALAAGDFDGDSFMDLAIGAPGEAPGSAPQNSGVVHVVYGHSGGLSSAGNVLWSQDDPNITCFPETACTADGDDYFGGALAVGDFNGDLFADLVIAAPGETIDLMGNAGGVHVLYGSSAGLTAILDQFWSQNTPGVQGMSWHDERFGQALAVGDFNGDGRSDLAIGVPMEDIGDRADAGVVHVLFGTASGLSSVGNQLWSSGAIWSGTDQEGAWFGFELAAGDFDGDGFDDLAIGVPNEITSPSGAEDGGAVHVLYGSPSGPGTTKHEFWWQDRTGVDGVTEPGDQFGWALATGDFDRNGFADLAVGVPFENLEPVADAGVVHVFYGSASGLVAGQAGDFWHQNSASVPDQPEEGDRFGWSLAAGDFNCDGFDELAIGIPGEDYVAYPSDYEEAGAVQVLSGSANGLVGNTLQFWHQEKTDVAGSIQADWENFGYALATSYSPSGRIFADGLESGSTAAWSQ